MREKDPVPDPMDDPMADVPEPESRFRYEVPWGILFALALIPLVGLLLLLAL